MQRAYPIASRITPHGAYRFNRGGGVIHRGIDLAGVKGTRVVAPAPGFVLETAIETRKPWTGYAPVVLMVDDDGWYHLLAHTVPFVVAGNRVEAGQLVGETGPENHTHWEVRTRYAGGDPETLTVDPLSWAAGSLGVNRGTAPRVNAQGATAWPLAILLIWTLSAARSRR